MPTPTQMMDALRALSPGMKLRMRNPAYVETLKRSLARVSGRQAVVGGPKTAKDQSAGLSANQRGGAGRAGGA